MEPYASVAVQPLDVAQHSVVGIGAAADRINKR